jgi:hypothetical protein
MKSIIVWLFSISSLLPAAIIDQMQLRYNGGTNIWNDRIVTQTFTPGITGQLDYITVSIGSAYNYTPYSPSTFSIVETVNGVPEGDVLGSVDVSFSDSYDWASYSYTWYQVNFRSEEIILEAGTQYGFMVSNEDDTSANANTLMICVRFEDLYSGGKLWHYMDDHWSVYKSIAHPLNEVDMTFRTYMVPEPTSVVLMGFGLWSIYRRKRARKT